MYFGMAERLRVYVSHCQPLVLKDTPVFFLSFFPFFPPINNNGLTSCDSGSGHLPFCDLAAKGSGSHGNCQRTRKYICVTEQEGQLFDVIGLFSP